MPKAEIYKNPKEFIRVFMEAYRLGKPTRWVGAKLGLTATQVAGYAGRLRKNGVELPQLVRPSQNVVMDDIDSLNQMVKHLKGE